MQRLPIELLWLRDLHKQHLILELQSMNRDDALKEFSNVGNR